MSFESKNTSPPPDPNAGNFSVAKPTIKRRPTWSAGALWNWFKRAIENFSVINGTNWSASFAYYAFFALVPLLLLLVTLFTDVSARFVGEQAAKQRAFTFIVANIPMGSDGRTMISSTLQGVLASRGQLGFVAVVGLLWSALGFFQSLVSAVNQAWGIEPPNWWRLPLKNLTMVAVLASALLLGNVLPAILKTVQGYVTFAVPWAAAIFAMTTALVPPLVLFYGFLLFYKLAPRQRVGVTFAMVWLPALLVTVLLVLCQQLFVVYTTHITNFNAVYGAFGGVIALMLWIYVSGLVVVFGGSLCATWNPRDKALEEIRPA